MLLEVIEANHFRSQFYRKLCVSVISRARRMDLAVQICYIMLICDHLHYCFIV